MRACSRTIYLPTAVGSELGCLFVDAGRGRQYFAGKVACLNNYPLAKMQARVAKGETPAQHLWGIDAIAGAGFDVRVAPFHEPDERNPLDVASRTLRWRLGPLDQEVWSIRKRPRVYYCADQRSASGIAALRLQGHKVAVVHQPVHQGRFSGYTVRGFDRLLALSARTFDELKALGANDVVLVDWGPDLDSPVYVHAPSGEHLVVSSGKSNRDLPILAKALALAKQPGLIYDVAGAISAPIASVEVVRPGGTGADPDSPRSYLPSRVYSDLQKASVIAIPIDNPMRLTGLTEINDALALGKPVILTRSPYCPIDVEEVGCGIVVEPGDLDGWVRALNDLADAGTRFEMGQAGRRWSQEKWNYRTFCDQVLASLSCA